MAVKEWFRRLQPVQLYLVLFFTTAFFVVEIIASHASHALTLLLNAYHMFCNIIAIIGCIASIKYSHHESYSSISNSTSSSLGNSAICINGEDRGSVTTLSTKTKQSRSDRRMKNTFGWARIDIVTMLVCCVFLASFCFSILMEALQTLVHIDHLDEMHHPLPVLCIGASGILLNAFCYILIGGYTFNQGIFLHVTKDGDVILRRNINPQGQQEGELRLSAQTRQSPLVFPKTQGFREMFRDVLGCIIVMVVSVLVYFTETDVAKYIDPIFAIISSISLFVLSYPYMKESGLILLQTIPNHINIDSLKKELLEAFPGIVNVHDLHVWQLTGEKIISTAHIIFLDPMVYASITDQVTAFFVEMGITQVTIQPEFHKMKPNTEKTDCLIRCHSERCSYSQCCSREDSTPSTKLLAISQTTGTNMTKTPHGAGSSVISLQNVSTVHEEDSNDPDTPTAGSDSEKTNETPSGESKNTETQHDQYEKSQTPSSVLNVHVNHHEPSIDNNLKIEYTTET